MLKLRPLFWPTLISLPIFAFTLGLGVWQMERREWKRDILDRIAQNQPMAPTPLDELLKGDPLRREYGRISLSGTFQHDKEFHLAARSHKRVRRSSRVFEGASCQPLIERTADSSGF